MVVCGVTRRLDSLADTPHDVLVIGGGIVGACVARDAARRGLRVALIERRDFGSGISWNSLKIVHGGLRSLQSLDVRQARAFVRERRAWLRIAPHLVEPIPFVVPTRGAAAESALLMRAALAFNDIVSRDRNEGVLPSRRLPGGRMLARTELHSLVPALAGDYAAGALFYDAQLYSAERLVYAVLADAERAGASVTSYAEAVAPLRTGGSLAGVVAEDRLTGERLDVRATMTINAAGAGAASVADLLTGRAGAAPPMTGLALNLMLAGEGHTTGFALVAKTDGRERRLFVAPWRGRTLVGTAHYECARAPQSDAELEPYVERFVREVSAAWPARSLSRENVLLVHSGMQPSPHGSKRATVHGPPEHEIVDHAGIGVPQLLTAIGPKLTMARAIAEQLLDIVSARLDRATLPCDTASAPLDSAPADDIPVAIARATADGHSALPGDVVSHLIRWYGNGVAYDAVTRMVGAEPALGARVIEGSPVIAAQLRYAAMFEGAVNAEDLIMRRTELGATARVTPSVQAAAQTAIDFAAAAPAATIGQGARTESEPGARGSRSL
ncbi:MAG: glpD 2 [Gemmatimonadetes bacterium]|nr:glpD 2 [Gemmatimonadota bacterium]